MSIDDIFGANVLVAYDIHELTPELEQIARDVIDDVANGQYYKAALLRHDVTASVFMKILSLSPELSKAYVWAKQSMAEVLVSEVVEIADSDSGARARNRIDARRWIASKYNNSLYGDKLDVNISDKVSVKDALEAAKERSALPNDSRRALSLTQVVDNKSSSDIFDTDSESVSETDNVDNTDDPY